MVTQHNLNDPNLPKELHVIRDVFQPRKKSGETGHQFAKRVALEIRQRPNAKRINVDTEGE